MFVDETVGEGRKMGMTSNLGHPQGCGSQKQVALFKGFGHTKIIFSHHLLTCMLFQTGMTSSVDQKAVVKKKNNEWVLRISNFKKHSKVP